mgnify:CR=1 FL=1
MKSSIDKSESKNKAESNYWPYLIKLNQFNTIIKGKTKSIRFGLTSSSKILFEYYDNEAPDHSLYKSSLNIMELYNLDDYFKRMKNVEEIYTNISEVLNKGEFNIAFLNSDIIILILVCGKKEFKINLNKQKLPFMNENSYELNEIINQLCSDVLIVKNALNCPSKNKNDEDKEIIKQLKEENKNIMEKLEKIEKEYLNQKNEINSLKNVINKLKNNKNNKSQLNPTNYPAKEDLNNNNKNNSDKNENTLDNTNPFYNYFPDYYNNSYLNYNYYNNSYYYQDYINNIQNNGLMQNINGYTDNYYKKDDDAEEEEEEEEEEEKEENESDKNHENNQHDYNYQNNLYYNMGNPNQINNEYNPYNDYLYNNQQNFNYIKEDKDEIKPNEQPEINEVKKLDVEEFNKKYETKYKDNKIKKLDLGSKQLGSIILSEISRCEFNNVKKLYLCDNDISNINDLLFWQNPNLEKLYFSNNKIKDISVLAKVNFSNLQILYLDNNLLTDISCLCNANFPALYTLSLHNNQITDISVFEKVNFKNLVFLSLHDNNISDISVFKKVKFTHLEKLYLSNNHINDLNCFENLNSFSLKELYLCGNEIHQEKNQKIILFLKKKLEDFHI